MAKIPLTKDGEKKLQEELKSLKIERPKISKAIAEAREHGDLKENAEYHAAREQQGLVEAKIKDIEFKLSNSEIIDNKTTDKKNHIIFGCTVELLNINNNSKLKYQIVGDEEADLTKNKISFNRLSCSLRLIFINCHFIYFQILSSSMLRSSHKIFSLKNAHLPY